MLPMSEDTKREGLNKGKETELWCTLVLQEHTPSSPNPSSAQPQSAPKHPVLLSLPMTCSWHQLTKAGAVWAPCNSDAPCGSDADALQQWLGRVR